MLTAILLFLLKLTAIFVILPFTVVFAILSLIGIILFVGMVAEELRGLPQNIQKLIRCIHKEPDDGEDR